MLRALSFLVQRVEEKTERSTGRSEVLMLLNRARDLSGPDRSLRSLETMLFFWQLGLNQLRQKCKHWFLTLYGVEMYLLYSLTI